MALPQARRLLQPVGGCLVQVHMEAGARVSYGPYRAAGKALINLLKRCAGAPSRLQLCEPAPQTEKLPSAMSCMPCRGAREASPAALCLWSLC